MVDKYVLRFLIENWDQYSEHGGEAEEADFPYEELNRLCKEVAEQIQANYGTQAVPAPEAPVGG